MRYLPIFIPSLAGIMICTVLVIFIVSHMTRLLRNLFSMLVICLCMWLLMYICELLIPDPSLQYVAISAKFAFMSLTPCCILLLTRSFFGVARAPNARTIIALLLAPALTTLLCWSNPLHHAFFTDVRYAASPGQMNVVHFSYGFFFYVYLCYSMLLMLWSLLIVTRAVINTHRAYLRMCNLYLLAIIIPVACSLVFVFADPFDGLDITPLGMSVSAFLMVWVVNDAQLMEIFPLGRSHVFQRMDIPMLYIDAQGYVADVNTAAARFFGRYESQLLYRQASDVCKSCLNIELETWDKDAQEVQLRRDDVEYVYLVRRTRLYDKHKAVRAQLLFFFDISDMKNSEESANYLVNYDAVTGLPNRNLFAKLLQKDINAALRYGDTLALFAVEIVNLRQINADYGFRTGEMLLAKAGELLAKCLRRIDTVAHIQTGQFYVILPRMTAGGLNAIIERLLKTFEAPIAIGETHIDATVHIGITFMPQDASTMDDLVSNADMALQLTAKSPVARFSYFAGELKAESAE